MKSIAVLAIVVMVVAGLAVNGSRAQPVPGVGIAAQQCQTGVGAPTCRPLSSAVSGRLEGKMAFAREAADDDGDPDWHWQQLVARVVVVVASWFAEHFGSLYVPDGPEGISEAIFDASR